MGFCSSQFVQLLLGILKGSVQVLILVHELLAFVYVSGIEKFV